MKPAPLKTFIIYARADAAFKNELLTHLHPFVQNGLVERWVDSDLLPGEEWEKRLEKELDAVHLVIMLVSADALASTFIQTKELKTALEKKRVGHARVVPILVRDCVWEMHADLAELQLLPKDANGVISGVAAWHSRDAAWASCLRELKKLIDEVAAAVQRENEATARQNAEQEAAQKQKEAAAKAEKKRSLQDDVTWKEIRADIKRIEDPDEQLALLHSYLSDPDHRNHRAAAEELQDQIQAELEAALKLTRAREAAQRKKAEAEAQRIAEAAARLKKETEARLKAAAEAREAAERKEREAEAQRKATEGIATMIPVKGGPFQMGEKGIVEPVHAVTLSDFEIGKYPVTQRQWQEIMVDNPSFFKGEDLPVEQVSWDDVQFFLKKLNARYPGKNYRLPTEAEWEYAARGGQLTKGFKYAGSNDLDEVGWFWENSGDKPLSGKWDVDKVTKNNCRTHPVGEKRANELGIHDMSGNVWEWCSDWYSDYPKSAQTNPTGPAQGSYRVFRGGSWNFAPDFARVANRLGWQPDDRFHNLGFRLARTT